MRTYSLKELLQAKDLEQIRNTISGFPEFEGQFVEPIISSGECYHYVSNGCIRRLKQGDVIGMIRFSQPFVGELIKRLQFQPKIIIPVDAFYFLPKIKETPVTELIDKDIALCYQFESSNEVAEFYVNNECNYKVAIDPFFNTKLIRMPSFRLDYIGGGSHPYIVLQSSKEQITIEYHKKEFSTHKFKKGDAFHFAFSNGSHLEYPLKTSPTSTNNPNYKRVSFSLLPQDIELFATESVTAIRCSFENGDAPLDLYPENDLASLTLKLYFQKYKQALLECAVDLESQSSENPLKIEEDKKDEPTWKDSTCFVYLMKDESNGFYKIGISNKPEYRERTLQSEKPTIVLLKAKEFPTRTIAESIESALHKAYSEKRLRGEWFELDNKDVDDVILTLS